VNLTRREFLATTAASALALGVEKQEPKSFQFAYFSDTHVALDHNIKENAEMFAAIKGESSPAFAINGGDVTDYGWAGEYDNYQKLKDTFGIKTYENMGNHDVRWSPQGEKIFKERLGPAYQFFTHQGVFFAILDSTVPLSHWGHFTDTQLAALKTKLEKLSQSTPVIIATHHWVGREQVMIDNENSIREILRKFNTKLILTGHGHNDLHWEYDGMTCTMNKGLYQGSWQSIEVDRKANEIRLSRYTKESGKLTILTRVPLEFNPREDLSKIPSAALLNNPAFTEIKVNENPWLQKDSNTIKSLDLGNNIVILKSVSNLVSFDVLERNPLLPSSEEIILPSPSSAIGGGGVMSHIHAEGTLLFFSSLDGTAFEFNIAHEPKEKHNSFIRTLPSNGYVHSAPLNTSLEMFVGDSSGLLRAHTRRPGSGLGILWQTQLPGPVYARPIIAQETLVIGNHGAFFGFHPETGEQLWRTPMPESNTAFTQSEPCTDGTRVYITCWDSHIYCLDAKSGEIVWRKPCQPRTFAFSPAIGSPCLDDDSVYCVANGNGLFRFNKLTGEQIYELAAPGDKFGHSSPVHHEGKIYAGGLGDNGSVWCVDAKKGEVIWECKTGSVIYDSSPTIGHGLLAIGCANGILNVIRLTDGKLLTQHRLGGLFLSTPLIHNQKLYAAAFKGVLHIFDLKPLIDQIDSE